MRHVLTAIISVSVLGVSACSNKGLRDLQNNSAGPDEFMVLPVKPLTQPTDYAVLPAPTPGASNLTDQNPLSDAVLALGGRPSAANAGGIPAADSALVTQASRNGVAPDTRSTLAEADAKFRKRQARMTRVRLFRVDRYDQAYRKQAIDPFNEQNRFRSFGVTTPTAPPS